MSTEVKDFELVMSLNEYEQNVVELTREIVQKEVVPKRMEYDEKGEFPYEIMDKFREAGLFAVPYPEEYGGMGMGVFGSVLLAEEIAAGCLGVATSFLANKLAALPIEVGATEEQKKRWLPLFASGEKFAAFCLTEPGAGSDVPALSTVAEKKGDRYILNGTKQWITNGGVADYYVVFALTDKKRGPRGISCFFVEKGWKGLSFGKKEDKLGIRASETRQVIFEDVEVPEENLIGLKPNRGFLHALNTLNKSRPAVAACAVGNARGAYEAAVKYAREREQFGTKIINFQAIEHMLADMLIKIEAARLLTYKAGRLADINHPDLAKYSAICKCYAADMGMEVCVDAVQIFGGYGYTKEYPVEKYMRDAKIVQIYEGTSQIQKNEIAQGIKKDAAKRLF